MFITNFLNSEKFTPKFHHLKIIMRQITFHAALTNLNCVVLWRINAFVIAVICDCHVRHVSPPPPIFYPDIQLRHMLLFCI